MTDRGTECGQAPEINPFFANTLPLTQRRTFLAHVALCPSCFETLRSLREDEKLASGPLTAEERKVVDRVVETAGQRLADHLESDRPVGERRPSPVFGPPFLAAPQFEIAGSAWRALLFAIASALLPAGFLWWYWHRL